MTEKKKKTRAKSGNVSTKQSKSRVKKAEQINVEGLVDELLKSKKNVLKELSDK